MNTRRLVAASGLLALATLAACSASDGSNPRPDGAATNSEVAGSPVSTTDTVTTTDTANEPVGVQPSGFTTVRATITDPDGDECEVCLWLADSPDERGRGLMGVTDLGDAVGMAFVFEAPTNGAFYMFQTPTPLSIAWFGGDGAWVASAEMEPCVDRPANECPLYNPGAAYELAIEVFADADDARTDVASTEVAGTDRASTGPASTGLGGLDELGLTAGSTVVLLDGTEALDCQTPDS